MVSFDSHITPAPLDAGNDAPRPSPAVSPARDAQLDSARASHPPLPLQATPAYGLSHGLTHDLTQGRLPAANTSLDYLDDVDCFDW